MDSYSTLDLREGHGGWGCVQVGSVLGLDRVRIGSRRGRGWAREVLRQSQGGMGGREQFQDGDNRVREGPEEGQD